MSRCRQDPTGRTAARKLAWRSALVLALSLAGLSGQLAAQPVALPNPESCPPGNLLCLANLIAKHPVRNVEHWKHFREKPLDERIVPGSPALVNFLQLDVRFNRIPAAPAAAADGDEMLAELRLAVSSLPANIRRMLDRRLVGVFLVRDFGGTGFSDSIRWDAREGAGYIVLDPDALRKRSANEWASWKENSPFRDDSDWRIEAVIADPADNQRQRAVQYILLHEIAHVLATRDKVHPNWTPPLSPVPAGRYPFFDQSWKRDPATLKDESHFDHRWPDRAKVRYYFGAQLGGADMLSAYRQLENTNFPSLYAATHPGDDFAESFVTYVHSVLQKRPWEIRILQGDKLVHRVGACWTEMRCAVKREVLEKMLAELEEESGPAKR